MIKKTFILLGPALALSVLMTACGPESTAGEAEQEPVIECAEVTPEGTAILDGEITDEQSVPAMTDDSSEAGEAPCGLTLTAKDVTAEGLTLVFTQSGGSPTGELETGCDFSLEKYVNGVWTPVDYRVDEVAWTEEAYMIARGGVFEMDINWSYIYGKLEPGIYRVCKPFMDFRGTADFDLGMLYAEFVIR